MASLGEIRTTAGESLPVLKSVLTRSDWDRVNTTSGSSYYIYNYANYYGTEITGIMRSELNYVFSKIKSFGIKESIQQKRNILTSSGGLTSYYIETGGSDLNTPLQYTQTDFGCTFENIYAPKIGPYTTGRIIKYGKAGRFGGPLYDSDVGKTCNKFPAPGINQYTWNTYNILDAALSHSPSNIILPQLTFFVATSDNALFLVTAEYTVNFVLQNSVKVDADISQLVLTSIEFEGWDPSLIISTEEGGNLFMNRYNPRVETNNIGCYILTRSETQKVIKDMLVNPSISEVISNKFFGTSAEALLGLKWFYGIKDYIPTSFQDGIKLGGVTLLKDDMFNVTDGEFVEYSFGNVTVNPYYGNFSDYTETEYTIYIPYVGIEQLKPDDVVGKTLSLSYRINLTSGIAVVILQEFNTNKIIFTKTVGGLGYDIPVVAEQRTGGVGSAIANIVTGKLSAETGVTYSVGGIGADGSEMSDFVPRVIIYRKKDLTSGDIEFATGLPASKYTTVSAMTGFFKVEGVLNMGSIPARRTDEIVEMLKQGVYSQ